MRYLIVGCGRVGSALAKLLDSDGHEVIVVDENAAAFKRLGQKFKGHEVVGTGIDYDVLKRAGAATADGFVAVTNGDNRNIMAALIAQRMFKIKRIVARIYDPPRGQMYRELGVQTVCPTTVGAKMIRDVLIEAPWDRCRPFDLGQAHVARRRRRRRPTPESASTRSRSRDACGSRRSGAAASDVMVASSDLRARRRRRAQRRRRARRDQRVRAALPASRRRGRRYRRSAMFILIVGGGKVGIVSDARAAQSRPRSRRHRERRAQSEDARAPDRSAGHGRRRRLRSARARRRAGVARADVVVADTGRRRRQPRRRSARETEIEGTLHRARQQSGEQADLQLARHRRSRDRHLLDRADPRRAQRARQCIEVSLDARDDAPLRQGRHAAGEGGDSRAVAGRRQTPRRDRIFRTTRSSSRSTGPTATSRFRPATRRCAPATR